MLRRAAELSRPFRQAPCVPEPFRMPTERLRRMIFMPVRPASSFLAVVAQHHDSLRSKVRRQKQSADAAIGIRHPVNPRELDPANALHVREPTTFKCGLNFGQVVIPELSVHRIHSVCPWAGAKRRIHDDDFAAFLPFFLPPRADFFAVVCRETGAAGDADDGVPSAGGGFSAGRGRTTFVSYSSTRPSRRRRSPSCSSTRTLPPFGITPKRSCRIALIARYAMRRKGRGC